MMTKFFLIFALVFPILQIFGLRYQLQIKLQNLEVTYVNKKYYEAEIILGHITRTEKAVYANITLLQPLIENEMSVALTADEWLTNRFVATSVQFRSTFVDFMKTKFVDIEMFMNKYVEPPATWPFTPNIRYHINGFRPNGSNLPSIIPEGRYQSRVKFFWRKYTDLALEFVLVHTIKYLYKV